MKGESVAAGVGGGGGGGWGGMRISHRKDGAPQPDPVHQQEREQSPQPDPVHQQEREPSQAAAGRGSCPPSSSHLARPPVPPPPRWPAHHHPAAGTGRSPGSRTKRRRWSPAAGHARLRWWPRGRRVRRVREGAGAALGGREHLHVAVKCPARHCSMPAGWPRDCRMPAGWPRPRSSDRAPHPHRGLASA